MISHIIKIFSVFIVSVSIPLISDARTNTGNGNKKHISDYAERISETDLGNAVLGILALGPDGDTLISMNANTLLIPASNMKLITTGLALDRLGCDFRYRTSLGTNGKVEDGILHGDLYILGGGDPTLASDDSIAASLPEVFGKWKTILDSAGIRKIDGHIIGDDRYFDIPMQEEQTWQIDDCGTYYGAGISALTFHENMQSFEVRAGGNVGDPVLIAEKYPVCPWMKYEFNCTTGPAGTGDRLYYYTSEMAPAGEMRGTFAVDRAGKTLECSNKFPAYTCAAYFAGWLEKNGIECSLGPADTGYFAPDSGLESQDGLTMIGGTESPGLSEIVFQTNHESNNVYAEILFHTLGKRLSGSADYLQSGLSAEQLLDEMGLDSGRVNIRDGSGLSRHNLLSPSFICDFLLAMTESGSYDDFVRSLPSPGSEGTMKGVMTEYDRAVTSRIRLKSGSMSGVKCFSGYIFPNGDERNPAVFSIMINNSLLSQYRIQKITDRLIFLIAGAVSGSL